MTVLIYVDTSKQVGDPDHLKVFDNADAAATRLAENDPEGAALSTTCSAKNKNGPSARLRRGQLKYSHLKLPGGVSGYPPSVPIEAGKGGNVCPILNTTRKIVEPPPPPPGR